MQTVRLLLMLLIGWLVDWLVGHDIVKLSGPYGSCRVNASFGVTYTRLSPD
jgi:hypothetical protein